MLINIPIVLLMTISFLIGSVTPSHAFWWMVYHKPEFKGKVIDAETKEPIEGAVVVVTYSKTTHLPPEAYSRIINVRETVTNKNGEFYIPSYTTIIQPLSSEDMANFIIFKPGYGSFPDWRVSPSKGTEVHFEDFFSMDYGVEKEVLWREPWKIGAEFKRIKVTFGIVELPKLKTREERLNATHITLTNFRSKDLPLLYKAINEEYKHFGLEEIK